MKHGVVAAIVLAGVCLGLSARAEPPPADPFFGRDKALHFGFSAGLAGAGYGLSALGIHGTANRVAMGMTLSLGAGYAKEVFDAMGYGTPSWKDFVWDVIGASVGVGIAVSLDMALASPQRPAIAAPR